MAAALGPHLARRDGEPRLILELHLLLVDQLLGVHGGRQDMELDVGAGEVGPGLAEGGDVRGREGEQALALEDVLRRLAKESRPLGEFIDRYGAGLQPPGHGDDVVVLKVLADPREIADDADPVLGQQRARTDARELQKLG